MKVGYVQFRPVFGKTVENLDSMLGLIENADADLIVLPELSTTGYTFTSKEELSDLAEPFDCSRSLTELHKLAKSKNCALVVGFAEKTVAGLYNSSALLRPDGSRELYRKVHLFGAENLFFLPGDIPFEVHDLNGVKIGMIICFDWFFPESVRVLALKGAQIICHPVNFVLPWGQRAMAIRALENHLFVVTANRYGTETRGEYSFTFTGSSQVATPKGEILCPAGEDCDAVNIVEIAPEKALDKKINKYNDLFASRRPDFYGRLTDGNDISNG